MDMTPRAWLVLVLSLPASNTATRMRIWRGLKALGCGVLRDGVYLLPSSSTQEQALQEWAVEIIGAGGSAHVLQLVSADERQTTAFEGLFDRTADYGELLAEIQRFQAEYSALEAPALARALKALQRSYEDIVAIDYFPGAAREQAAQALARAEAAAMAILSPDEPHTAAGEIQRLDRAQYQGRIWATRQRLWVDRLASAWLIQRFIDPEARFLWLEKPSDCPKDAIGVDFDGAAFTHIGARVTFEVLLASFGLESDPALSRLAALVHYLDVGGIPVPEAAGLNAILRGARLRCDMDDALLAEATKVFDCLYAAFARETSATAVNTPPIETSERG
jgi:hypothetical protein